MSLGGKFERLRADLGNLEHLVRNGDYMVITVNRSLYTPSVE